MAQIMAANYDEALKTAERGLAADPLGDGWHRYFALIYQGKKDWTMARSSAEKELILHPEDEEMQTVRAMANRALTGPPIDPAPAEAAP